MNMEANSVEAQEHEALLTGPEIDKLMNKIPWDCTLPASSIKFPPQHLGGSWTGERPKRDVIFKFLFLGTIFLTYGIGIVAFTRADFTKLQRSKFNPATNECELGGPSQNQNNDDDDGTLFLKLLAIVPLSALVMTFPAGLCLLWLLHRYTRGLVMVTAPLMCLIPLGICIFWFTWCYGVSEVCATMTPTSTQILYAVYMPGLSALFAHQLWRSYSTNPLEVGVELIKMATTVLKDHFWLLVLNPVLSLGSMVLVNGPIFAFIWYAVNNGQIVPNLDVVNDPSKECDNATGYPCCREQRAAWVSPYVYLAIFTTLWVFMVTIQLQLLVVNGTVAHWYFDLRSSSGNIKQSLRYAFGSQFGTACNLGTIITPIVVAIMGVVNKAMNRRLNGTRQGIVSNIVRGCISWMSKVPECNSRFASNFAAISGDSFWESSKKANQLLQRNFLLTGGIYSLFINYAFMGMIFIYGIFQAFVVYSALEYFIDTEYPMALSIALLCLPVTMIGLGQFHQAISCVMDIVYICYAMEKDVGEISKPEVCHAFALLPREQNGALLAPDDKLIAP